jgi:6-phosphofructokinase 1
MNEHGIDGLVVIGGDGSLSGAYALAQKDIKVIGVPGSIDNDIYGTNMSIGVDTALNTILMAIDRLRDTASSHNRAFLVEVMGRNCGYLAVMAGIIGGAEMVLVPELDVKLEVVANVIESAYTRGKNHSIIVIAEGAHVRAQELKSKLDELDVGFRTRVTILGHIQRGGRPTAFDRLLATRLGVKAAEALIDGETGKMVGLMDREVELIELSEVIERSRTVNMDYYKMAEMLAL